MCRPSFSFVPNGAAVFAKSPVFDCLCFCNAHAPVAAMPSGRWKLKEVRGVTARAPTRYREAAGVISQTSRPGLIALPAAFPVRTLKNGTFRKESAPMDRT
jgi:hypothetical protein